MNEQRFPLKDRRPLTQRFASILAVAAAASLVACASGVPLNDVPVTDRSATPVSAIGQGSVNSQAQGSGAAGSGVSSVRIDPSSAMQPDAMSRIVYFDYDSFVVKPEYTAVLEANARYLKADSKRRVSLEGHTDERGGREYNLALGQKRAEAVRRALSLLGVSDQQAEAVSFGEEKPAVTGLSEDALSKNRRVEITYR